MNNTLKKKAVLVEDKAMNELLKRKVSAFRDSAKLKDKDGIVRGIGAYALYGIDHVRNQVVVLASEPTAADFAPYVSARAKADACSRYDHVVEYRDAGRAGHPKEKIIGWTIAE